MSLHARRPRAAALRLKLFKADTKGHLAGNEKPTVARILRRFAPGTQTVAASSDQQFPDQTPRTPLLTFSPGIRALVAVLVLVALLPNLTLGAIFWLGVLNTPWSRPVTVPNEKPAPAAQSAIPPAVLSAPGTLEATAGEDVTFPIALDGTDGVPARSIIAVSGLPQGSAFSSGRPYGETEWNLKSDEIGDLHLVLPKTASGEAKLLIQLVAPDGAIIADTATVLKITTDPNANIGASKFAEAHVMDQRAQALGATAAEESFANLNAATVPSDPVPLPSRRPAPTANVDNGANWIKPLAFVNLRERPSPSARVISVIPKGAKLRVIGRKDRWVQVTHSATSERGWIYAVNVATMH
jgi:SH3 domain-containing protein